MRILVVSATAMEIDPFAPRLQSGRHRVELLTTGVGMVATAASCSRTLTGARYDLALNVGVCGSFDRSLGPGSVVHVVSDRIAELGAEDGDAFLTIHDLKLVGENEFPLTDGMLLNARPPASDALRQLPAVSGITVNTVHGNTRSIAAVVDRFHPQVESMEGAAFMYACLIHEVPFAQVRAVSNVVEQRSRVAWKIDDAIRNLGKAAAGIIDSL